MKIERKTGRPNWFDGGPLPIEQHEVREPMATYRLESVVPSPRSAPAESRKFSDSDWALLQAVKVATTDDEKNSILQRAAQLLDQARREIGSSK